MDTLDQAEILSIEEANNLVLEHHGWAESIARAVARSWNLDWKLDGLDGAALEALIFCARRFQPARGVPFRGYARKRIHEASTEAARKSKSWARGIGTNSKAERQAREISSELFFIFPELRSGQLPFTDEMSGNADGDTRAAIRSLLTGANIIATKQGISTAASPEEMVDYKKTILLLAKLEIVHQLLMWLVYWEGLSLRNVADNWETDELNVIREHQALLAFLQKSLAKGKNAAQMKIRPGLRAIAHKIKQEGSKGPFSEIVAKGAVK